MVVKGAPEPFGIPVYCKVLRLREVQQESLESRGVTVVAAIGQMIGARQACRIVRQ